MTSGERAGNPAVAVLAPSSPATEPLARLLLERAVRWGQSTAGARTHVTSARFPDEVAELARALEVGPDDPFLIVWPRLGRPEETLARAALEDLRTGCAITLGPVFDGGLYLLGVRGAPDTIAEVPAEAWHSEEVVGAVLATALRLGLDVGLLRTERGLRRPADVRAALADPLLDEELRAVLAA